MIQEPHQEWDVFCFLRDPRRRYEAQQGFGTGAQAGGLAVDLRKGGDEGCRGGAADGWVVDREPLERVEAELNLGRGAEAGDDGGGEGGDVGRGGGEEEGGFDIGDGDGVSLVDFEEGVKRGGRDFGFREEGG